MAAAEAARSRRRRSVTAFVLVAMACLGAGAAVGILAARSGAPTGLADPPAAATIGIALRSFDDSRSVQLTLRQEPGAPLSTQRQGVVTASSCSVGGTIKSGEIPWSVAGVGLLALHTTVPFYRNMKVGDAGPDVTGLKGELHRLDSSATASGGMSQADLAAMNRLLLAGGSSPFGSEVTIDRTIWLPQQTVRIASCAGAIGATVSGALATTAPTVTGAALDQPPSGLLEGKRVLMVDGNIFNLDGTAPQIENPDALAKLLVTSTGAAAAATVNSNTPVPLQASYALASPIQAATVPASAVLGAAGATCIIDAAGATHPVRVVDSQLGRSIVQFKAGPVPTAVTVSPGQDAQCS